MRCFPQCRSPHLLIYPFHERHYVLNVHGLNCGKFFTISLFPLLGSFFLISGLLESFMHFFMLCWNLKSSSQHVLLVFSLLWIILDDIIPTYSGMLFLLLNPVILSQLFFDHSSPFFYDNFLVGPYQSRVFKILTFLLWNLIL